MVKSMKVLITGGSGLLGRYLIKTAPADYTIAATWHTNQQPGCQHHLNIANFAAVRYVFGVVKPDIVIHCAANGSVDHAENNYQEAHQVNVMGCANVSRVAKEAGAKMVYISSNAVYDGNRPAYRETSPKRPINSYGKLKKLAEEWAMYSGNYLIFRPFLLYGWPNPGGRGNWASIVVDKLRRNEPVKMVNDHIWMPTYAGDCAAAIWSLIGRGNEAYNVAAPDRVTLYDFAVRVAEAWGLDASLIEPVSSDYFKGIAPRPHDTSYDLTRLTAAGVTLSGIDEGLKRMRAEKK